MKKFKLGCGGLVVVVLLIPIIFILLFFNTPHSDKVVEKAMVENMVTETFGLPKKTIGISFDRMIQTEAGHYSVYLDIKNEYQKNRFLKENLPNQKVSLSAPYPPKEAYLPYGEEYWFDVKYTGSLHAYMVALGFNDDRHDVTELAQEELSGLFLKPVASKGQKPSKTTIYLEVKSAKGWQEYLADFYPYQGGIQKQLHLFSPEKDYFMMIVDELEVNNNEEAGLPWQSPYQSSDLFLTDDERQAKRKKAQQGVIAFIEKTYRLDQVPQGTLFVINDSGEKWYLFYEAGEFREIYKEVE